MKKNFLDVGELVADLQFYSVSQQEDVHVRCAMFVCSRSRQQKKRENHLGGIFLKRRKPKNYVDRLSCSPARNVSP